MDGSQTGFSLKDHATPSALYIADTELFYIIFEIRLKIEIGL